MLLHRAIEGSVLRDLQPNKVVIIYGPRQVGKTTLIQKIRATVPFERIMMISGEDLNVQDWLSSQRLDTLKDAIGDTELLIIDEAQMVKNIGINLKLIVDHFHGIRILATGSSSFELAHQVGEPLVGRKWQYNLYPIAQMELNTIESRRDSQIHLEKRLIFGGYPQVIFADGREERSRILTSIVENALYRDILALQNMKHSDKLTRLLRLIAFQIGHEVSLNELATQLEINRDTVERYLYLLEQVFVIKRVAAFSRNLRKEISKSARYYFWDNGIRNAIIGNFNPLDARDDIGKLWENYLFMERLKKQHYGQVFGNTYFWRTYDQKEIDLVEEREGKLFGYEFTWSKKSKKAPKDWLRTYENAKYTLINQTNYLDFVS